MDPVIPNRPRLDSWKAIADYLHREVATVRRWEKTLGLPVRRLPGGRGHSVYAYPDEIDAWLQTAAVDSAAPRPERRTWRGWLMALPIAVAAGTVIWWTTIPPLSADDLRVELTDAGVFAFDSDGKQRWRHSFPASHNTRTGDRTGGDPVRVVTGRNPMVYVRTAHRVRRLDNVPESGELLSFDVSGSLQRRFSFTDEVTMNGTKYGPPWAMSAFAIDERPGRRLIAVASHHYLWFPSIVTVLDEQWHRRLTFVHAGWIEYVHWMDPTLLVGGFSQPHNGGMLALIDGGGPDSQGPEPAGSPYYCESCGTARPYKMVVMQRSEVNQVSGSRFNRAIVQVTPDRIVARTIEVPATDKEGADTLYEFTFSLDLISATYSARYWDAHRALELAGKLDHARDECPDRDGPRTVLVWEPAIGWSERPTRTMKK